LLEAIEEVARFLKLPTILLCSTDDAKVKGTWQRLGFSFTEKADLERFGVTSHDLIHMDNTVQMHKAVPEQRPWRSVRVRHGDFQQRLYYLPGSAEHYPRYQGNGTANGVHKVGVAKKPAKVPVKKQVKKKARW
jgi:hypothetical protein